MPIRELALILFVGGLCVTALLRPKIGLYGYVWFAIVQPDVMAWCEGVYPFSLGLAICTILGSLRHAGGFIRILRTPFVQWVLLLQIPLGLSVLFSEGPFLSPERYENFERTAAMIAFLPLLLETEEDIRWLIYTLAISGAILGGRFGLFGIWHGGVILNQPYGHHYDNNELALAIAMLIPVCWYCRQLTSSWWFRTALLAAVLTSTAGVIMTNSRGASLALGTVFLCLIFRSRRRLAAVIVVALAVGPALYLVHDQYFNRMATIENYQDEASAATRVELWGVAIEMWKDYPFIGVGYGGRNFAALAGRYLHRPNKNVAHNSYLQMLTDCGTFGFLIFVGLLFGSIFWLGKSARYVRSIRPGAENIPIAFQVSLLAYAVGCTFYSLNGYDLTYILFMSVGAWYQVQKTELSNAPEETTEEALAPA